MLLSAGSAALTYSFGLLEEEFSILLAPMISWNTRNPSSYSTYSRKADVALVLNDGDSNAYPT